LGVFFYMYYLYHHYDTDNNLFYIGKGTKDTWHKNGHNRAHSKHGRSNTWKERAKAGYTIKIIEESNCETCILEKETSLINQCNTCINKTIKHTDFKHSITRIDEFTAILSFTDYSKNWYILKKNGTVYGSNGQRLLGRSNGKGYTSLGLSCKINGKQKTKNFYVHRLIAEAFVPNPNNYKIVNHKNNIRNDNGADNLEWTTQKKNVEHALKQGHKGGKPKKLYKLDENNTIMKIYRSAVEASIELGCTRELINQAANKNIGKCKTAKGYKWMYEEDYIRA
jgi:hypothetical protein